MDPDDWTPEPFREAPDCGRCCDRGHVGPYRRRCPDCNPGWWRRTWRRLRLPRVRLDLDDLGDDLPF